jgi:hypothetical protein
MQYERFVIEVYVYTGATSVNAFGQYIIHDGKNELIKAIAEHSESRLVAVIPAGTLATSSPTMVRT